MMTMNKAIIIDYLCNYLRGYLEGRVEAKVDCFRGLAESGKFGLKTAAEFLEIDTRGLAAAARSCAERLAKTAPEVVSGVETEKNCAARYEALIRKIIKAEGEMDAAFAPEGYTEHMDGKEDGDEANG